MFTRDELIKALEAEGMEFIEDGEMGEESEIAWHSKFEEIEREQGETGFSPFMGCGIDDKSICFTSILNSKALWFNRDLPGEGPTLEEYVEESKRIIEEFYRDL